MQRFRVAYISSDRGSYNSIEGYSVYDGEKHQLVSVHVFDWKEAKELRREHEEAAQIKENWPDPDDPEVVALLNDQSFEPVGQNNVDVLASPVYRLHMAAEAIARKRAGLADDLSERTVGSE